MAATLGLPVPSDVIAPRFLVKGESWPMAFRRIAATAETPEDRNRLEDFLRGGIFVPAGQVWRGAGRRGAILLNCYVTAADIGEDAGEIAARITSWTERGCGVGINLSSWLIHHPDRGPLDIAREIGRSQQRLWDRGITRTATMLNFDLMTPDLLELCRRLHGEEVLRHLNIGVLCRDDEIDQASRDAGDASGVLQEFIECAWAHGNPGFIFIDQVNRAHPLAETLVACNPCAEQFLIPEEGCNLGSINLGHLVRDRKIDFETLAECTSLAVRFLDSVLDQSSYPTPRAEFLAGSRRRIGLGVTGLGTMFERLGVAYGSRASLEISSEIATAITRESRASSEALGHQRGHATGVDRRNLYLTSIAPAGAISRIWSVSTGIEPTSREVPWQEQIDLVAAWQGHLDGGISKTVLLPADATIGNLRDGLLRAWRLGCKGISFFRRGCRWSDDISSVARGGGQ